MYQVINKSVKIDREVGTVFIKASYPNSVDAYVLLGKNEKGKLCCYRFGVVRGKRTKSQNYVDTVGLKMQYDNFCNLEAPLDEEDIIVLDRVSGDFAPTEFPKINKDNLKLWYAKNLMVNKKLETINFDGKSAQEIQKTITKKDLVEGKLYI